MVDLATALYTNMSEYHFLDFYGYLSGGGGGSGGTGGGGSIANALKN